MKDTASAAAGSSMDAGWGWGAYIENPGRSLGLEKKSVRKMLVVGTEHVQYETVP